MSEKAEPLAESVRGPLLAIVLVRQLHSKRVFNGDGYGWSVCAECRQAWPCATEQAIASVDALHTDGEA